jgi:23S rRNA pseudouridine1911/1915/1917 synthase
VNIPVVYEDEWLLVLDKPSGLIVMPTPKKEKRTLTSILNEDLKHRGISYRLHPCHRLDRETSGLIIYAKGKFVQKKVTEQFKNKKVKKIYIAFVHGRLKRDRSMIKAPIEGLESATEYEVIERKKDFDVVKVMPVTGRTNQIRLHFKGIGHPLVGETRFAFRKDFKLRAKRLCLHAKSLHFFHPITNRQVFVDSELPLYMRNFLKED